MVASSYPRRSDLRSHSGNVARTLVRRPGDGRHPVENAQGDRRQQRQQNPLARMLVIDELFAEAKVTIHRTRDGGAGIPSPSPSPRQFRIDYRRMGIDVRALKEVTSRFGPS